MGNNVIEGHSPETTIPVLEAKTKKPINCLNQWSAGNLEGYAGGRSITNKTNLAGRAKSTDATQGHKKLSPMP